MVDVRGSENSLRHLMVRGLAGDGVAYREFLVSASGHLRAFFRKRLAGLPDEVEDLVQETLLALHNKRHTYDTSQPLTAWVYAIAHYKMVDLLRRRAHREALSEPLDEEAGDLLASTEAGNAAEARRDVTLLLQDLPDRWRLPIVHMKLEGMSVAETVKLTGMSESAVKIGVHRGLKALAARMREEG